MGKQLIEKHNKSLNYTTSAIKHYVTIISLIVICFASVNAQVDNLKMKNKNVNGDPNPYFKIGQGEWPCGQFFSISLEDEERLIFSAASATNATLAGNNIVLPDGSSGHGKRKLEDEMNYQKSFDRIRDLKVGYTQGVFGKKWNLDANQLKEMYQQNTFDIILKGEAKTAFDRDNIFYEMLISVQTLASKNEALNTKVALQQNAIKLLLDRIENLESTVYHQPEIKMANKININPNPSNGKLNVSYNINNQKNDAVLVIVDMQGKSVYQAALNAKINYQTTQVELPAGNYLYYLTNTEETTKPKKLIIQ